jgi:hypothetical protein
MYVREEIVSGISDAGKKATTLQGTGDRRTGYGRVGHGGKFMMAQKK